MEKKNKLFDRTEYIIQVEHPKEKTPTREEAKEKIAEMLNVDKNKLVIKKIVSKYGLPYSFIYARVYDNIDTAKRVELKQILRRNNLQ